MEVAFIKMHGLGNDYLFIDGMAREIEPLDWAQVARAVSHRHTGVGSDGIILILPPPDHDVDAAMRIFNADGSEGDMCGNGLRCLAWYIHSRGYSDKDDLAVSTRAGTMLASIIGPGLVKVDMGPPRFGGPGLPVVECPDQGLLLDTSKGPVRAWPVFMGNPNAVIFPDTPEWPDWKAVGPEVEHHPAFPDRTNVEFVYVRSPDHLEVRVWERGSGPTMACGTGAAAALIVAASRHMADRRAVVSLPGGDLCMDWRPSGHLYMTGPAASVFEGTFSWPFGKDHHDEEVC